MTEYPSIERHIRRVETAPHGQKTRRLERLRKARTATLRREIKALSTARAGKGET